MKKVLIILLAIMVLVVIVIAAVFLMTSGVTKSADTFFQTVRDGDLMAAYALVSEDFKAATSQDQFEGFLKSSALLKYQTATWTSRSVSGKTGEVEGTVETSDGGAIPIKIMFVKEQGKWKILNINKTAAGLVQTEESGMSLPGDSDLKAMADVCMRDFALAIQNKDFSDFYATLSELWKSQTTAEKLQESFQGFVDQEIDLTVLSQYEPVFSKQPAINDDGVLELEGYYATQPSTSYFTLRYIYEHPEWKLAGIHVTLK